MAVELKIPEVGESIKEVQIGKWLKKEGERVERDQPVVEVESDKATVELPAPTAGVLSRLMKKDGDAATVGEVIGYIEQAEGAPASSQPARETATPQPGPPEAAQARIKEPDADERTAARDQAREASTIPAPPPEQPKEAPRVMPAARRALAEQGLRPEDRQATGPGGRLLKEDVQRRSERAPTPARSPEPAPAPRPAEFGESGDETVPMSPMRRRIAERLVQAQQTAALLTTFNEIDMSAVIDLREQHREDFHEHYGVKLGFMSFFVKASLDALKQFPQVNAEIRDTEIVYHRYYDIGIAIGSGKGLIVPVLRNADRMSFGEIERAIADLGQRARENKIRIEELQGGTFSISNGGIYGSLLSTPIVNPPQSGILGMHAIQDRPVARDGQVVIRPMMYVALTYDHRLVDGREAVTFLRRIKQCIEAPARMLLEI